MKSTYARSGLVFSLVGALGLAACDRGSAPPAAVAPAAASGQNAAPAAVTPQPSDLRIPAAANATGPSDGVTAIGGVAANQDGGGAKKGGAAAPTAGDGAASASTPR